MDKDLELAIKVSAWIADQVKGACVIQTLDTGAILISYDINKMPQPSVRVHCGRVVFPQGSNFNLVFSFLGAGK